MEKTREVKAVDSLDDETVRMVERMVIIRISTKHINLWIRQLEMKRKETGQQAVLMRNEEVKREIQREKSFESWARAFTNHFLRKIKRMLYEEIDNIVGMEKRKNFSNGERETKCMMKSPTRRSRKFGREATQTLMNLSD